MIDLAYLRLLTSERIPAEGSEADTSFTNAELTAIISQCGDDVNLAASEVWKVKAGLIQLQIESYKLGEESVNYTKLQDLYKQAIELSDKYRKQSKFSAANVFSSTPPDVLHEDEDD